MDGRADDGGKLIVSSGELLRLRRISPA
jgi:hypothetical protein